MSTADNVPATRAAFVMEQHLGHLTYYRNLRAVVDGCDGLAATWVEVDYEPTAASGALGSRLAARGGPLAGRRQVVEGLRLARPDVAFFNTQVPAVLAAPEIRQLPYIVATDITPRQYDAMAEHYDHEPDRRGPVAAAKHAVNVRVLRRADRVACWSSWCAASVVADYGVPEERVVVIGPGVDLSIWQPGAGSGPSDRLRILFVGGDLDRKGGRVLIEAFGQLPAGLAELHLVTRTPYRPEVDGIVVHADLVPNSPELIALYQSCDVFVLPSKAEAFGIAAVEASACGLPLIASRSGGLTDIVDDGASGFSLPSVDAGSLAGALQRFLDDDGLGRRMGAAARAKAEAHYDAAANGIRVADLVVEAAERHGPRTRSWPRGR